MRLEPWDDERVLQTELHRLLLALMDDGPLSIDGIRRLVLRPDELAALMPTAAREDHASQTIDNLIAYLENDADSPKLIETTATWRKEAARIRKTMDWNELTPATTKRTQLRACLLLLHAEKQAWVEPHEDENTWRLTEKGLAVIDDFSMS